MKILCDGVVGGNGLCVDIKKDGNKIPDCVRIDETEDGKWELSFYSSDDIHITHDIFENFGEALESMAKIVKMLTKEI